MEPLGRRGLTEREDGYPGGLVDGGGEARQRGQVGGAAVDLVDDEVANAVALRECSQGVWRGLSEGGFVEPEAISSAGEGGLRPPR